MLEYFICIFTSIVSIAFSSGLIIGLKIKLFEDPNLVINEIADDITFYYFAAKIAAMLFIPLAIVALAIVNFVGGQMNKIYFIIVCTLVYIGILASLFFEYIPRNTWQLMAIFLTGPLITAYWGEIMEQISENNGGVK